MKKGQPPQHSKKTLRVPPQSPPISLSSSASISPNLQKLPSEQIFGQKMHKSRASPSPKRLLTSSNRSHLIRQPSQVSQVSQVTQQKQESSTPKSSVKPHETASSSGQHNQNIKLNKLNSNISSSKKQQQQQSFQQQSFQSQQKQQTSQQQQKKKKQQQPNIQRPILSSASNNRNSNNNFNSLKFDPTANLPPVHSPDFHYIFERKLEICSKPLLLQKHYNETLRLKKYEDPELNSDSKLSSSLEEIRLKTLNLNHILQLFNENSSELKDDEKKMIINMVMKNILRLLRNINPNLLFSEESLILPDPEWPHLEIVYLILIQMQVNFPNLLKYDFCRSFFTVFNSSDENERNELIHFFIEYIKVRSEYRNDLMKDLTNLLNMHIELSDRPFVVLTVLPIFKEICMLSEQLNFGEYDKEIKTSIIPLLRDKYSFYFIPLIDDILSYYSDENPQNARLIVEYLLKYWPQTSTTKQSNYTTFLAEMLHELNQEDLRHFLRPVLKLFESEIVSTSPKLAESSLTNLEQIIESFGEEANETILEIMIPPIMKSVNDHWWDGIREEAKQIMTNFFEKHDIKVLKNVAVNSLRKSNDEIHSKYNGWNEIFKAAKQNDSEISNSIDEKEKQLEILFGTGNGIIG